MGIIYKITNKKLDKAYIGSAKKSFSKRYLGARWWAYTHNLELQDDAFKYGSDSFSVEVLEEDIPTKDLLNVELELICSHGTMSPNGYNKKSPEGNYKQVRGHFFRKHLRRAFYEHLLSKPASLQIGVKLFRLILNMTQEDFAKFQKVPIKTLRDFEQGKGNPTIKTLQKMLRGSGLTLGIVHQNNLEASEKRWGKQISLLKNNNLHILNNRREK